MNYFKADTVFYSIRGEKRKTFLQGIITRNIETLEDCIYALILTPKGRLICDLFIYKIGAEFLLETDRYNNEELLKTLNLYNFKKTVEIEEKSYASYIGVPQSDSCVTAFGMGEGIMSERSKGWPKGESTKGISELLEKCLLSLRDPRSNNLGFRIISSKGELPTSKKCQEEYHLARIKSKIPEARKELTFNIFPLNYGMEYAFDFDKGCYVGQEVISRFKRRGLIEKDLFCVKVEEGIILEEGAELSLGNEVIGHLSSCCKNYGLVLLPKAILDNAAKVQYKTNKITLF